MIIWQFTWGKSYSFSREVPLQAVFVVVFIMPTPDVCLHFWLYRLDEIFEFMQNSLYREKNCANGRSMLKHHILLIIIITF
jgi:hypothetical protein